MVKKIIRRFGASAIRHFVAVAAGVQAGATLNWVDPSALHQIGMAFVGGLVGPGLKALLETADELEK
jgi:hypothetical protein